ncbi:MAG TPA: TIGR02147 family protein [bacterium]|nr:TIGR02147 family protein [bacterium]
MRKKEKPDINLFIYSDYRKFLRNYYQLKKKMSPGFSFRSFSKAAGFTSPNYLKLIMDGERNLSGMAIDKFIKALRLNVKEARFFRLLVLMNQASTPEEKDFYARQIVGSKAYQNIKPLNKAQYCYYSQWYHIPLRELVLRSDFNNDPVWIARQFTPPLTEKQAKEGLETLLKLQLIEMTPDGKFVQTSTSITSGDAVTTEAVKNYHRTMIRLGAEAIERFPSTQRDISSLTMGMSTQTANEIKKRIADFQEEIMALVEKDSEVQEVVQLNFQLFPLVKGLRLKA